MKTYKIKTKFVFNGTFEVKAKSKDEAREMIKKHCGLVIGGDIHTTLPDDMVNWEFNVHPDKIIP
jgi:predicted small metal-binding protein